MFFSEVIPHHAGEAYRSLAMVVAHYRQLMSFIS